MGITTTLGALAQADPALQTISALKLSAKAAYSVKKLAQLVAPEIAHFQTARNALITELGAPQAGGSVSVQIDSPAWPEFVRRVTELADVAVEVPWNPITLEMLGEEKVSASELIALGPLLAEPV